MIPCRDGRGRKRVLLIAAAILAARKLSQYEAPARVPATLSAIADAIRYAEQILTEIDRRWPAK
jgi:16S rRNA C1402 (ribose-2'-O) methylase RsmI